MINYFLIQIIYFKSFPKSTFPFYKSIKNHPPCGKNGIKVPAITETNFIAFLWLNLDGTYSKADRAHHLFINFISMANSIIRGRHWPDRWRWCRLMRWLLTKRQLSGLLVAQFTQTYDRWLHSAPARRINYAGTNPWRWQMMHTIVLLRSVAAFEDEGLEYLDLWRVLGDKKVLNYKWDFI